MQNMVYKTVTYDGVPRPIWLMFSGLGSQWAGMGTSMMKLPAFSSTIQKCQKILLSKGIDLAKVITDPDPKTFEDNVNITVGITAIQLALVDLLKMLQISPTRYIGYSIGEVACAYVDEALTLEEAILCSYFIGLASKDMHTEAQLVRNLKKVIATSKKRSPKWMTTTENTELARYCSAEYLVHSLSCSVTLKQNIPKDAVVIEIAPHGHLQNLLKKAFSEDVVTLSLMQREQDNLQVFFSAVGKLYLSGCNPRVEFLYPEIQFPVSRGTPMISPLIKWKHDKKWHVPRYEEDVKEYDVVSTRIFTITVREENKFLTGHTIDGRILYPATGYLTLAWRTLAMFHNIGYQQVSVIFENVKFLRATHLAMEGRIYLMAILQPASGNFEITENDQTVATGRIRLVNEKELQTEMSNMQTPYLEQKDYYRTLTTKDIYKELRLRGYYYSGMFRGIHSCDVSGTVGELIWKDNYITFMDTMLQIQILQTDTRGLFIPTLIEKVVINTQRQQEIAEEIGEDGTIPIYSYKELNLTIAGGVEIQGVQVNAIARRKPLGEPVLETYKFVPNNTKNLTLEESIRIITQLALENIPNIKVRTAEILDDSTNKDFELLSPLLQKDFGDLPLIQADINVLTTTQMEEISGIMISDKNLATESNCLLVVGTNLIGRPQVMLTAFNALSEGGFVIARECLDFDVSTIEDNVQVILCHELEKEKILLLRRANKEKLQAVVDVSNAIDTLDWVPLLQSAVKNDPNTVVYSQGDELSGVLGLVNCIRKEPGTNNVRCVFIMDKDAPKFDLGDQFYAKQLQKGLGVNVLKNGIWGTYRHLLLSPQKNVEVEHAYVNVTVRGDLSSLRWIQGDLNADLKLKPNQLLIYTYYAALNFRDIMTATGRIAPEVLAKGRFNQECVQGLEYSGRLLNGQRVMGMINSRALSTMLIPDPDLLWVIPDHWTLEDAATVPVVYGTVIYAFIIHGKIERGKTILIHSGSGGIGQAAINVALYYGLKVYTTVGTPEKREFIKKTWPQIKDNQIGNSRDISFEQMIMVETNGRGVDYVLNSLAEEKLQASIRCLARGGKFLEIGKFDLANNNPLPLSLFEKDASFHGVMLDNMFDDSNDTKKALSIGLATCIRDGAVKPLTRTVFCDDEVEEAFRFMATGKHMGKVLIKIREEETEKIVEPKRRLISAVPRYLASPEGCYVITGGLGGFGLELADWLVLRGARNLVLTSRRGIMTGYQASRIRIWRTYGVRVKISTADITTFEGGKLLIKEATEMGPVEGVFNLAVVLRDAILENQTVENFEQSFGPKAVAAKYLDGITRRMCPKLRLFVIFSSVSCGRGNAGQTNYGMANSIMERICEQRKMANYPALAIEWGAVGEVGLVAEMQENHGELEISGTLQQKISSCLSLLDQFFKQDDPIVSSIVVAEKKSTSGAGGNIIDAVANILGIHDIKTVSFHSSLAELGMDSIMAVEIKQTLEREFEVFLTPQDIRSLSFARLQNIASEKQEASSPQEVDVSEMGMKLMFRTVGDEKTSAESIIVLPSLAPPESKTKVILIPGIEGMASVLEPLAKNLEAQAVCLQLGFVNQDSEISEMANALLERTLFQLQDTDKFVMIGYSFGAAITLELAVMLELNGKIGKVILLDGSPSMLRGMANLQLVTDNEDTFQNAVLSIILNLYLAGGSIPALRMAFEKQPTWEEKVNAFLENVPKNITLSKAYQIAMCEAIYRRLKAISSYDPSLRKLKSNITLIKPLSPSYVHPEEDFGLSQFSESPVDVITVEGNHVTILENKDSAEEINKIIKREFKE